MGYNGKPGGQFDSSNRKTPVRTSSPGTYGETPASSNPYGSIFKPFIPTGGQDTGYTTRDPATGNSVFVNRDRSFQGEPLGGLPYDPSGGNSNGGGVGGGGGVGAANMASIMKLLGRKPQQYAAPQAYKWEDLNLGEYDAPAFRQFDGSQYDMMRGGITEGLAADAAAGGAAYGDARTELSQYQNPFTDRQYSQNTGMPEAMQRMLAANDVSFDPAETAQGVQADQAFGNVLALLGGTADQSQASSMRALGGDERRFNESLASQGRTMNLGVDMAKAKALEAYEQEKWQYGESVARANYETRMQQAMTNNTGRNQTGQANTQQANETNQANTQLGNDYQQSSGNALIDLLASGQKIDPAALAAYLGG